MIDKLEAIKRKADAERVDRENYQKWIESRKECGYWTIEDIAEYKGEVRRIMASGTEDEKEAAREFWRAKV